jgi:hypothetical protein
MTASQTGATPSLGVYPEIAPPPGEEGLLREKVDLVCEAGS